MRCLVPIACITWLIACGGAVDSQEHAGDTRSAVAGDAACTTTLAAYDPYDRSPICSAARAYVECDYPDGLHAYDMSNDPTKSPWGTNEPGVTPVCKNLCDTTREYAAMCNGAADPPAGCRDVGFGSSDPAKRYGFFCCPCGT